MATGTHLKAALLKNWLLWKRELAGSLCEIFFPILLMVFLYLMRLASDVTDVKPKSYLDKSKLVSPSETYLKLLNGDVELMQTLGVSHKKVLESIPFWWCGKNLKYDWTWALAFDKSNEKAASLASYLESEITSFLYLTLNATNTDPRKLTRPKIFKDADDMEDYVKSEEYGDSKRKICFGIDISGITEKDLHMHIRYNVTSINPDETYIYGEFLMVFLTSYSPSIRKYEKQVKVRFLNDFFYSGFLTVQNLAINWLSKQIDPKSPEWVEILAPLHGIRYTSDGFLNNFTYFLGFFMFITSLVPVCRMISNLVSEKESKARESMKMMGLNDIPYWLSWYIMYTLIYFCISLGCTFVCAFIFEYSSKLLLFTLFFLYGQSCLAYSILISSLFSKTKTAILVGMLVFFLSNFSLLSITRTTDTGIMSIMSLFNTFAMSEGFFELLCFESSQIGMTFESRNEQYYNYSVGLCMKFLLIDSLIYWVLGLYLDKVVQSDTGVSLPWYFPFTREFWKGHSGRELSESELSAIAEEDEKRRRELSSNENIEPYDRVLQSQLDQGQAMKVRSLRKRFGDKTAVDGLDLDMFKGQIFALLGHNGAGKTTTISMLTGMMAPTSGEMTVNGLDFKTDMQELRKTLGVCPQHDILFKTLTVEEHLFLFCRFKGLENYEEIAKSIEETLRDVDLLEKRHAQAGDLSGGQKRKLSLAIALIGGSSIVMLDEPTSGMDLTARRKMWDMLKVQKRNRIIILTTHYMEEADILADRIAIMSSGKLYCLGSPLFLKKRFGVGYNLSIVKKLDSSKHPEFGKIESLVSRLIPEARVFNKASAEIIFEIPLECTFRFREFFEQLDLNIEALGIETYGVSVTTLEEVFIRVSRGDEGHHEPREMEKISHFEEEEKIEGNKTRLLNKFDSESLDSDEFNIAQDRVKGSLFWSHFLALTEKRMIYSMRDVKGIMLEIFLPIVFIVCGLVLLTQFSVYKDQTRRLLSYSHYDKGQHVAFYAEKSRPELRQPFEYMKTHRSLFSDVKIESPKDPMSVSEFDYYLYKSRKVSPQRLGSYYSVDTSVNNKSSEVSAVYIWGNTSAYASLPTYANEIGRAYINSLRSTSPFFDVKIYNYPLPLTKKQENLAQNAGSFNVALIFAIGMAFIPTGLVTFIVKERETNVKHQHLVSGVSIPAYWLSSYAWDFVKFLIPGITTPLLINAFDVKSLSEPSEVFGSIWVLFLLFGLAICPHTYSVSFMFKSYSAAQFFVYLSNLILGVIGSLSIWVLIIVSDLTRDIAKIIVYPLRILSPLFCLSHGLMTVGNRDAYQLANGLPDQPEAFDWDITGADICFLVLHVVFDTAAIFLIEWLSNVTFFRNLLATQDPGPSPYPVDEDVERVKQEVKTIDPSEVAVKVQGLRKIYGNLFNKGKAKVAIQEVSFSVPKQQAFALLGVNGAGKTTTFRILTGEYGPTVGEAYISGFDIVKQLPLARYNIGYCPQFDALSEVLTPPEHLKLYAKIKGIPDKLIPKFVQKQIRDMGLTKYLKVQSRNLSGGNKRKLSVAIATIGNPPVVFLDEPSAGMDPGSRKNMWEVVNKIKRQKCSIILTTHSMDEAESLCNTIAIMVGGRFRCYGTATHIKNKYSSGYEFLLKVVYPTAEEVKRTSQTMASFTKDGFVSENSVAAALRASGSEDLIDLVSQHSSGAYLWEEIKENQKVDVLSLAEWVVLENIGTNISEWLKSEFGYVRLIEHYGSYYKFKIENSGNKAWSIGMIFGKIENVKDELRIFEYSLSQTTLEQIFNMFASEGEGKREDGIEMKNRK
jgi:ATP-binding cassette subfamily A (ABC1) protein 3